MNLDEIRKSGLLELYVLGLTNEEETAIVLEKLKIYEALKYDLLDIETALQIYSKTTALEPSFGVKANLMKTLKERGPSQKPPSNNTKDDKPNNRKGPGWIFPALLAALLGFVGSYFWQNNKYEELSTQYKQLGERCDSLSNQQAQQIASILETLGNENFDVIPFGPGADKYAGQTKIYIHYNTVLKEAYLQLQNLPPLTGNESFKLWSIKEGVASPIPLNDFNGSGEVLIPITFEEGTGTYAITLESEPGKTSPDLTNLIGTVTVES